VIPEAGDKKLAEPNAPLSAVAGAKAQDTAFG
jgi:hypothetical protein